MATNAMIYVKYYDSNHPQYRGVQNLYDGYPEYLGKILLEYYDTTTKVESLFKGVIEGFRFPGIPDFLDDEDRRYKDYDNEYSLPTHKDYHYVWDDCEKKWYISEWDKHDWRLLENVLAELGIAVKSPEVANLIRNLNELKKMNVNGVDYVKLNDVAILIEKSLDKKQ